MSETATPMSDGAAPPAGLSAGGGPSEEGIHGLTIAGSLRANMPFLVTAALYLVIAFSAFTWAGLPLIRPSSYINNAILYSAAAISLLGPLYLYRLFRERPESPIAFGRTCATDWRLRDRFRLAVPALLALIFFMPAFSAFKSAIPAFNAKKTGQFHSIGT